MGFAVSGLRAPTGDQTLDLAYRQGSPQGAFQGASGATRNRVLLATTTETFAGKTPGPCTACTIVVNAQGDAGLSGATMNVYPVVGGLRSTPVVFTLPNPADANSHRFAVAGFGVDWYEVSLVAVAPAALDTIVVCAGFGVESAGGTATLGGTGTLQPSDVLTNVDVSGGPQTRTFDGAPSQFEVHTIKVSAGNSAIAPVTVNGNGKNLEDPNSPGVYGPSVQIKSGPGAAVTWQYDGTRWEIIGTA
jgi:hypothetical protein